MRKKGRRNIGPGREGNVTMTAGRMEQRNSGPMMRGTASYGFCPSRRARAPTTTSEVGHTEAGAVRPKPRDRRGKRSQARWRSRCVRLALESRVCRLGSVGDVPSPRAKSSQGRVEGAPFHLDSSGP